MIDFEKYENIGINLKDLVSRVPDNCELCLVNGEDAPELVLKSLELPNFFLVLLPDTVDFKDLEYLLDHAIEELEHYVEGIKQDTEFKSLCEVLQYADHLKRF